jgi:hypothetical protein
VRTLMTGNVGYSIVIGRPEIALAGDQLFYFLKLEMTCNDCNDGRVRGKQFSISNNAVQGQWHGSRVFPARQVEVQFYIRR